MSKHILWLCQAASSLQLRQTLSLSIKTLVAARLEGDATETSGHRRKDMGGNAEQEGQINICPTARPLQV